MADKITGVCCNDAGAAELISSYILHHRFGQKFIFCLNGPSVNIFEKKLGKLQKHSLTSMVKKSNQIFFGTGWSSDFEITGINKAKDMGKHSIVFLDHWVNYKQRFQYKDNFFFPDEIWVSDLYAKDIASNIFKQTTIKLIKNYFLDDIKINYKKNYFSKEKKSVYTNFLFISGNYNSIIDSNFLIDNPSICRDEVLAEYFLKNLGLLTKKVGYVVIRPHPAEVNPLIKYKAIFDQYKVPFIIGGKSNLQEEISDSDIVVGGDSMALVVAMTCGKQTYSCCPPNSPYTLPFDEIKQIRQFQKVN